MAPYSLPPSSQLSEENESLSADVEAMRSDTANRQEELQAKIKMIAKVYNKAVLHASPSSFLVPLENCQR